MTAVIKTGGKQYNVKEGDILSIEKLGKEPGAKHEFLEVVATIDNGKIVTGTPLVEGAKVQAEVLANGRGKKIIVFKYKPKKGYQKTQGHRQAYTKVKITKVISA